NREVPPTPFVYPDEFDELGRSFSEHSYIAVVHADGDGIGQRFLNLGKQYPSAQDNVAYLEAILRLSEALNQSARLALRDTVECLRAAVDTREGVILHRVDGREVARVDLKRNDEGWLLPFRPIVFGGDD